VHETRLSVALTHHLLIARPRPDLFMIRYIQTWNPAIV